MEMIRATTITRKEQPEAPLYMLELGESRVYLSVFTAGELEQAAGLERQIWSLKQGEHRDLEAELQRQAFELIVASASRGNPNRDPRPDLERMVAAARFTALWKLVRQTAGRAK